MLKKSGMLLLFLGLSLPVFAETYSFPVNPPRELDFLSKVEIFRVRNEMIEAYPIFFQGEYKPETSSVFRQIKDGKPWWGLKGLLCYGPGKLSIEGESDESRFIDNPFLLISMEEGHALILTDEDESCPLSYPEPKNISFDSDTMTFNVDYNVSDHEQVIKDISHDHHERAPRMRYSFNGRNAIDFGVPYVYMEGSRNLRFLNGKNMGTAPYRFRDFIHVGGSCKYPGGCNNGSPYQAETEFQIQGYPAFARFKLWRQQPKSVNEASDLTYEIHIN